MLMLFVTFQLKKWVFQKNNWINTPKWNFSVSLLSTHKWILPVPHFLLSPMKDFELDFPPSYTSYCHILQLCRFIRIGLFVKEELCKQTGEHGGSYIPDIYYHSITDPDNVISFYHMTNKTSIFYNHCESLNYKRFILLYASFCLCWKGNWC